MHTCFRSALARRLALLPWLAALPWAATAQTPGTYTAMNDQGLPMQIEVATAADGVSSEVRTIQSTYWLSCERSRQPVYLSSWVFGYFPVDAAGRFDAQWLWDRDEFHTTGEFGEFGTVTGLTHWSIASVVKAAPHLAQVCASPELNWSGTHAAAARGARRATRTPTAEHFIVEVELDRAGQVVRQSLRSAR